VPLGAHLHVAQLMVDFSVFRGCVVVDQRLRAAVAGDGLCLSPVSCHRPWVTSSEI
jgi:hypothetical protein